MLVALSGDRNICPIQQRDEDSERGSGDGGRNGGRRCRCGGIAILTRRLSGVEDVNAPAQIAVGETLWVHGNARVVV